MTYPEIVAWLAKDILDSTDAKDEIEANVDRYIEDLTQDIQEKAQELGEKQFRLLSETNTEAVRRKIAGLARRHFKGHWRKGVTGLMHTPRSVEVFFEHEQWHVRFEAQPRDGYAEGADRTFNVVDAEPGIEGSGLDFEEV